MLTRFTKEASVIFLDPHSKSYSIDGDVNVILSPSLYWVKKVSLPVKYLRDVKPLLPSLFEDTLPEGDYSYNAYKSDDSFFIFAYNDKEIIDMLSEKGISFAQIRNVYFAQSELSGINGAVKINETQSIYVKDEIVVLVPCCWIEESGDLDISSLNLSKHYIRLQQFGHIVNNRAFYKIISIFIWLIVIVAGEYFITLGKISTTSESRDELFSKNGLKSTMIENRSMLKSRSELHDTQTKLREYMHYILDLKLKAEERISFLSLDNGKIIVEFSAIKSDSKAMIEKTFKSKEMSYTGSMKDEHWHVEIEL